MLDAHVSGLFVYPVKSLRGIALRRSPVDVRGLEWDRHWMVVDENGRFRTQRQIARMAQIATALTDEALVLSADGCGAMAAPLEARGEMIEATVWGWTGPTQLVHPKVDRWLSEVLEMPCRLVAMPATSHRPAGSGEIAFADGMPTLVIGEASLDDLNSRLETPVPMDRFRANIVVRGSEAYAEDGWKTLEIGGTELLFSKLCARCLVPTTDQETGERDSREEPLRTLARERLIGGKACFGAQFTVPRYGEIAVGDSVKVP